MTGRDLVIEFYQAFAARDGDRVRACFHPDARWVAPPGNATQVALGLGPPDAGAPDGSNDMTVDRIVDFISNDFDRLFSDTTNDIRTLIDCGDRIVVEQRFSARLANGRSYVNDYCFVFDLRDGRIAAMREYMDTRGGWAQVFGDGPGQQIA